MASRAKKLFRRFGAAELARRVGVSTSTVHRWVREGTPRARADDLRAVERRSEAARRAAETRTVVAREREAMRESQRARRRIEREERKVAQELQERREKERRAAVREQRKAIRERETRRVRVAEEFGRAFEGLRAISPAHDLVSPGPFESLDMARRQTYDGQAVQNVRMNERGWIVGVDSFGRPLRAIGIVNTDDGTTRLRWRDTTELPKRPGAPVEEGYEVLRPKRYQVHGVFR